MNAIKHYLRMNTFFSAINLIYCNYFKVKRKDFGYIDKTAFFRQPILVKGLENVYLHENTSILGHSVILSTLAKFIMKKNSGAAEGLTVVTGNHVSPIGKWHRFVADCEKDANADKDVIVEEDVWIATNVTLLAGVTIGRGAIVGAGSVCRNSVPPSSIVIGNPAKVIGFKFTPEEIVEHEKCLYVENERLPLDMLERNYARYYKNRIKEIVSFIK